MGFRFPLAAVLRLREIEEGREERLLSRILVELAQAEQTLRDLDAQIAASRGRRAQALEAAMPAAELQSFYARLAQLAERRSAAARQLAEWQQRRDQQLLAYRGAHQRRELLAAMRAEQRDAYLVQEARQEQKSLDDLFLSRRRPRT